MALKECSVLALRHLYAEAKKFHLRPIKKLNFQFDPFHANAKSVREILFHLSSRKIRKTSDTCIIKTEVVCDRSEPTIALDLHNGMNILFKCANLNSIEIARELNNILRTYDTEEQPDPLLKFRGIIRKPKKKYLRNK